MLTHILNLKIVSYYFTQTFKYLMFKYMHSLKSQMLPLKRLVLYPISLMPETPPPRGTHIQLFKKQMFPLFLNLHFCVKQFML